MTVYNSKHNPMEPKKEPKSELLQIRITPTIREALRHYAFETGIDSLSGSVRGFVVEALTELGYLTPEPALTEPEPTDA